MQMNDIIDECLEDAHEKNEMHEKKKEHPGNSATNSHRERLASLAAGGQTKQYLGKEMTTDQIDSLDDDAIEKLYTRYEARLGAAMTKTLGQSALQLYSGLVSMFLPIPPENRPALIHDLETDPFVGHALGSATCELYHRYGMFLAPLTAALTTVKYCQFENMNDQVINESYGNSEGTAEGTESCRSYEESRRNECQR